MVVAPVAAVARLDLPPAVAVAMADVAALELLLAELLLEHVIWLLLTSRSSRLGHFRGNAARLVTVRALLDA